MRLPSLVVFHRHGHRAPARNIFKSQNEIDLWSRLTPEAVTFDQLNNVLPVQNYPTNPLPRDLQTAPFGIITSKGIQHLEVIGALFAKRFVSSALSDHRAPLRSFATNYQRTQASGQSFIKGVLNASIKNLRSRDNTKFTTNVRRLAECSMSFYEGRAELAARLMKRVQSEPSFKALEARAEIREVAELMLAAIPHIHKGDKGTLDWLAAFDYFVCRREHSLLDSIPMHLLQAEDVVYKYMAERYGQYFTHRAHLAHFALPLLRDLETSVEFALGSDHGAVSHFSCHDVNVLGLLYAFEFDELDSGYWPAYGCTVTFVVTPDGNSQTDCQLELYLDQQDRPFVATTLGLLREKIISRMEKTISSESI